MLFNPPAHIPHKKFVGASAPTPSRTTNHEPRNLEIIYIGARRGEANPRIPYVTQSTGSECKSSKRAFHPACAHSPYKIRRPSGRHLPEPRTPNPEPRNLEKVYTGPCRGEAKTRIPYVSQSPVTTNSALSISMPFVAQKKHL